MNQSSRYIYDSREVKKLDLDSNNFTKALVEFFQVNSTLNKNENFYCIRVQIDENEEVTSHGAYLGDPDNLLAFSVFSQNNETIFLAEVLSAKAMEEFIGRSKKSVSNENIYVFKTLYENFELLNIKSMYGGNNNLSLYVFEESEEDILTNPLYKMGFSEPVLIRL